MKRSIHDIRDNLDDIGPDTRRGDVTSGKHLTLEDRDRILRLAGSRTDDGGWRWSYSQIAERCEIHPETVSAVVRLAAVKWWQEHRWRPSEDLS